MGLEDGLHPAASRAKLEISERPNPAHMVSVGVARGGEAKTPSHPEEDTFPGRLILGGQRKPGCKDDREERGNQYEAHHGQSLLRVAHTRATCLAGRG